MSERPNVPVLVGPVPLLHVTSLVVNEGYKTGAIAGSSIVQLVAPTTKTIAIEALLPGPLRSLRPALEGLALTNRFLSGATAPMMALAGVPVVAKTTVHLDMQITSLAFTQDNQMRDTLKVSIGLTHVPRSKLGGLLGGTLGAAVAVGSAFV